MERQRSYIETPSEIVYRRTVPKAPFLIYRRRSDK